MFWFKFNTYWIKIEVVPTKTKRKVNLVSSHSDNERENGPLAACSTEGSAVSDLYKTGRIPTFMRYLPKDGERVVYEEITILGRRLKWLEDGR